MLQHMPWVVAWVEAKESRQFGASAMAVAIHAAGGGVCA